MKITLLANICIDTEVRLERMKDSFESLMNSKSICEFVINLRGKYSREAMIYLLDNTAANMNVFNIESSKGWFYDTQELLKKCSNEILFYWVEDHICMDLN